LYSVTTSEGTHASSCSRTPNGDDNENIDVDGMSDVGVGADAYVDAEDVLEVDVTLFCGRIDSVPTVDGKEGIVLPNYVVTRPIP
jgi:hypothetical protein